MTDQLTVRVLIDRLQRLVAEQPAIADMLVELQDADVHNTPCFDVAIGPRSIVLGEQVVEWVQCVCGHEVSAHRAPGGKCTQSDCLCSRYETR